MINKIRLLIKQWRIRKVYDQCYSDIQKSSVENIGGDLCPGLINSQNNVNVCKKCPHYFARR